MEGSIHSAECSAVGFVERQSYLITGAYDGDGRVRLWIDHRVCGVAPSGALRGPIEATGDPLILGARRAIGGRPATPAFRGKIRHLMVRGWGPRDS